MNYFGLFFTFMVPGLVLGAMAAAVVREEMDKRRKKARREQVRAVRGKLYVYDLNQDMAKKDLPAAV